jgi:hypothetical protein
MHLTITNYGKIKGLTYYGDGSWDILHFSNVKSGAIAKVEDMREYADKYVLTLLYIQPQPETATVTIWRKGGYLNGVPVWQVDMHKKGNRIVSLFSEKEDYEMTRLLESIKVYFIY